MALDDIPPLPIGVPIVDPKTGAATREFAQWWQQMFGNQGTLDADKVPAGNVGTSGLTMATNKLLGRQSADTGAIEELSLSEALDLIGSAAQGDILFRGASGWERLAAGTSGYYLKTNGAAADPAWAAVSGGGGLTEIGSYDFSVDGSASNVDFTDLSSYTEILVTGRADMGATSARVFLRLSDDNGSTFKSTGNYQTLSQTTSEDSGATSVIGVSGTATAATKTFAWRLMGNGSGNVICSNHANFDTGATVDARRFSGGTNFDALSVIAESGTFGTGTKFTVYGM